MTVAIADSVDASPQTSIKSWTCGDVKKWLNEVGLENRLESELQNSFFSLTALGLMSFSSACQQALIFKIARASSLEFRNAWNPSFLYSSIFTKALVLRILSGQTIKKALNRSKNTRKKLQRAIGLMCNIEIPNLKYSCRQVI